MLKEKQQTYQVRAKYLGITPELLLIPWMISAPRGVILERAWPEKTCRQVVIDAII
jgi:hypothetical protein